MTHFKEFISDPGCLRLGHKKLPYLVLELFLSEIDASGWGFACFNFKNFFNCPAKMTFESTSSCYLTVLNGLF